MSTAAFTSQRRPGKSPANQTGKGRGLGSVDWIIEEDVMEVGKYCKRSRVRKMHDLFIY